MIAAGLFIAFEVAIAVVARVLGEPAANWFTRRLGQYASSGFERRYRAHLLDILRHFENRGSKTVLPMPVEFDPVVVGDLSLLRVGSQQSSDPLVRQDWLRDVPVRARRSISDFIDREEPEPLVVIGTAGSGKTTLLQHTVRQICKSVNRSRLPWPGRARRSRADRRRRPVPVLLHLRDHAKVWETDKGLPEAVRSSHWMLPAREPDGWLEQQLEDGRCVVLLDGLDEVSKTADRQRVSDWVANQIRKYPKNDYVITSRPHGYWTAPLPAASVLQIERFTDEQIEAFVRNWYLTVECCSGDMDQTQARKHAKASAEDLLMQLRETPALRQLVVNPLLLNLIATVHRERDLLPKSRAELYEEICEVLLWRRHQTLQVPLLPPELSREQRMHLLEVLAFEMMDRRVQSLARNELLGILTATMARLNPSVQATAFLDAATASGLLFERERDVYEFAHITFQEYLTAARIDDPSVLIPVVDSPWWRETILLYVALSNADRIVKECLEIGSPLALTLALDCEAEARELDPELRQQVKDLERQLPSDPSPDPAGQISLIDKIKIVRDLRPLVHIDDGGFICARPIGAETYDLFLREIRGQGELWADNGFVPAEPTSADTDVAAGMRGSDASAFAEWLTERAGNKVAYRLPRRTMINELVESRALKVSAKSIWVVSDAGEPELWTPSNELSPHEVAPEMLRKNLEADMENPRHMLPLVLTWSCIKLSQLAPKLTDLLDRCTNPKRLSIADTRPLAEEVTSLAISLRKLADKAEVYCQIAEAVDCPIQIHKLADELAVTVGKARDSATALAGADDIASVRFLQNAVQCRTALDDACPLAENLREAMEATLNSSLLAALRASCELGGAALRPDGMKAAALSKGQIEDLNVTTETHVISPDTLASTTKHALDALRAWCGNTHGQNESRCAPEVADELERVALPAFNRELPFRADVMSAIRTTAICLAATTDSDLEPANPRADHSHRFQQLAAGATLLEARHLGQAPATETIHLALADHPPRVA